MPEKQTVERASNAKRKGKSASTQAGEFVREEMHHIREGKHGARSTKQAIAIGLSKARRAGVDLPPPEKGHGFREDSAQRQASLPSGSTTQTQNISPPFKSQRAGAETRTAEARRQEKHFRGRRVLRRESARGPNARLRHAERRKPRAAGDVPPLLAKRRVPVRAADRT